uniref:Magnesium transporter n=1 Tax=Ananas comosus var. bracteatus TaxID=296719 RepID=A0A6V7NH98_ANACO|nr:unnamed protein product [Ananas comosus var. bracteatus]
MRSSNPGPPHPPPPPPPPVAASGGAAAARRKGAAASREWLVVSATGRSYVEEVGKHSIMDSAGLPARDLRVLDPLLSYPSSILGRERAIVINLEHIKAIITATEVLIPNSKDPIVAPFVRDLQSRITDSHGSNPHMGELPAGHGTDFCRQKSTLPGEVPKSSSLPSLIVHKSGSTKILPFEFRALEVCLESACRRLESETTTLEQEAYPALDELTSKISTLNLEHVRQIKSRLVTLSGRVQKVRDELEHLLDDDSDMAEMYLTRKISSQGLGESMSRVDSDIYTLHEDRERNETESNNGSIGGIKPNIEELEMLLEAYFVQIEGTLNKLSHLREYVDDTEDYINIMLDDKQNQLLQMGVMLTTATVVATAGIVVVSLFGMNIHIELMKDPVTEQQKRASNINFWETTLWSAFGCLVLYILAVILGKRSRLLQ